MTSGLTFQKKASYGGFSWRLTGSPVSFLWGRGQRPLASPCAGPLVAHGLEGVRPWSFLWDCFSDLVSSRLLLNPSTKPEQTGPGTSQPSSQGALCNGASLSLHWPLRSPDALAPNVLTASTQTSSPRPSS